MIYYYFFAFCQQDNLISSVVLKKALFKQYFLTVFIRKRSNHPVLELIIMSLNTYLISNDSENACFDVSTIFGRKPETIKHILRIKLFIIKILLNF